MENEKHGSVQQVQDASSFKMTVAFLWILSLIITGYLSFVFGQSTNQPDTSMQKKVLSEVNTISSVPTSPPQITERIADNVACAKSGYAQQWEYLKSYVIKEKDTLPGIAASELHDENRVNEIMQINGIGPLVVGSTLYLPPDSVDKSSGKLKQVHGKLIEKNASMWHVSFNEDKKGIGVLIPTYWFEGISNKDEYKINDCLTILLDDGFKVFSVSHQ